MSNTQDNGIKRPLWAPWRVDYIRSEKEAGCFLCRIFAEQNDRENLLLVAPFRHAAGLADLTPEETLEIAALTSRAIAVLSEVMAPQGFNIGYNLGEAAGAGLKDHLHQHIVPRWIGDTNFMPVLGGPRVIPEALEATYDLLFEPFNH